MSTTTFDIASAPAKDQATARALGARRKMVDRMVRWACVAATIIGLIFLASILATLIYRGFAALDWTVLTKEFEPTTYGDDTRRAAACSTPSSAR
jgi:phosphate transport system permease protein